MGAGGSFREDKRWGTVLLVDRAATFGTFHQQAEAERDTLIFRGRALGFSRYKRDDSIQPNVSSYEITVSSYENTGSSIKDGNNNKKEK